MKRLSIILIVVGITLIGLEDGLWVLNRTPPSFLLVFATTGRRSLAESAVAVYLIHARRWTLEQLEQRSPSTYLQMILNCYRDAPSSDAKERALRIAESLLHKGSSINALDVQGLSSLHYEAALEASPVLTKWLLDHGANPNIQASSGYSYSRITPLQLARFRASTNPEKMEQYSEVLQTLKADGAK